MLQTVSAIGGARIGWLNATWPMASFNVNGSQLTLKVFIFGTYTFAPDHVVSLEKYGLIPFLGWGVRINHRVPHYPKKIVFWCFRSPNRLIQKIRETGFVTTPAGQAPVRDHPGFPVRWQAIAAAIVLWNVLFLLDMRQSEQFTTPGPFTVLALLLLFLGCLGIKYYRPLQRMVLKEGRKPEEIGAWLNFLTVLSGIMLFIMILTNMMKYVSW
jgi:hypothetical protein